MLSDTFEDINFKKIQKIDIDDHSRPKRFNSFIKFYSHY